MLELPQTKEEEQVLFADAVQRVAGGGNAAGQAERNGLLRAN